MTSRFLFDLPVKEQARPASCRVCGGPGRMKVYEVGRELVMAHYQCFAQLLAEISRLRGEQARD